MQKAEAKPKSPKDIKALILQKRKSGNKDETVEDTTPVAAPKVAAKRKPAAAKTEKPAAAGKSEKTEKPEKAEKPKADKIKYRHLIFCEPYSQDIKKINDANFKDIDKIPEARGFKVPEAFYEKLLTAPKKYHNKQGTAFVFGDLIPADPAAKTPKPAKEYKKIAEHVAEGLQTGIIDYDAVEPVPDLQKKWEPAYPEFNWNNRTSLKKIQKDAPFVLWVGEAAESNPKLYAHYKQGTKQIDSLVVDMGYFYPTETVSA